ncbi:MAG: hypothetical protein RB191_22675 [Terriglobia bacterium]|nr:hypothetical protein [Terriglobia bacterium]
MGHGRAYRPNNRRNGDLVEHGPVGKIGTGISSGLDTREDIMLLGAEINATIERAIMEQATIQPETLHP